MDEDGPVVDALPAADYLFVTPSHQSPTTATLSLERRQWLLRKAELQDFVIIEDDYEAENLYEGTPMPALKSSDKTGRVIYVGSVSKSLSPALRLGFIVAPRALIKELRAIRHAMVRHPSAFLQHVPHALFLSLGHHESHARRVNHAMQERLALAAQALRDHLPDFRVQAAAGRRVAVGCARRPGSTPGGAVADGTQPRRADRGRRRVLREAALSVSSFFRLRLSSIPAAQISAGIRALGLAVEELAAARGERPPRGRAHALNGRP